MTTKRLTAKPSKRIYVVATSTDYQKLCLNCLKRVPAKTNFELVSLPQIQKVTKAQAALIVSRLADFSKDALEKARAHVGPATRQLVFLDELPVEAVAARLLPLNIRNPERIHIAAQRDRASIEALISRVLSGMTKSVGSQPLVDAWIEENKLLLLSPTFSRLEIPLEKLARFIGANKAQLGAFEIDEDGRFLHWPHADVHLGWEQLEQIIDPAKVVAVKAKTQKYHNRFGDAIRQLRESHSLKQTDVQGITERQLRRVEHGEQTASKATLEALAKAHSLSLADYVDQLAKREAALS